MNYFDEYDCSDHYTCPYDDNCEEIYDQGTTSTFSPNDASYTFWTNYQEHNLLHVGDLVTVINDTKKLVGVIVKVYNVNKYAIVVNQSISDPSIRLKRWKRISDLDNVYVTTKEDYVQKIPCNTYHNKVTITPSVYQCNQVTSEGLNRSYFKKKYNPIVEEYTGIVESYPKFKSYHLCFLIYKDEYYCRVIFSSTLPSLRMRKKAYYLAEIQRLKALGGM